jgi:hypothetical protein
MRQSVITNQQNHLGSDLSISEFNKMDTGKDDTLMDQDENWNEQNQILKS